MNDVRLYYGETKYHYKWSYNLCVQKYEHGIVHGQTFFFFLFWELQKWNMLRW